MRIGIDARLYGKRGLGRYVQELLRNLENIDQSIEYFVFLDKDNFDLYRPRKKNFKKFLAPYKVYSWKEQIFFPFLLYKYKLDLVHFPHFNVPLFYFKKFIVTIHDLILLDYPTTKATTLAPFLYKVKYLAYKIVIYRALFNAQRILTISNYVKNRIQKHFKIDPQKIIVIYNGLSLLTRDNILSKNRKYQKSHYILYVGSAYPHKNLERLIDSFAIFVKKYNLDYNLVLVGGDDYFYDKIKEKVYNEYINIQDRILFLGYVSDSVLALLYKNASVLVFPSLCEGFGLPPLEAMSWGVPVVCARSSCLPEILDDAVYWFNPTDLEDIVRALYKGLTDQSLRKDLIQKGYKLIEKYSWEKAVLSIFNIYKEILEN